MQKYKVTPSRIGNNRMMLLNVLTVFRMKTEAVVIDKKKVFIVETDNPNLLKSSAEHFHAKVEPMEETESAPAE